MHTQFGKESVLKTTQKPQHVIQYNYTHRPDQKQALTLNGDNPHDVNNLPEGVNQVVINFESDYNSKYKSPQNKRSLFDVENMGGLNPHDFTPVLLKKQNNILPSPIVPLYYRANINDNFRAFGLNLDLNHNQAGALFDGTYKKLKVGHNSAFKKNPNHPETKVSKKLQAKLEMAA